MDDKQIGLAITEIAAGIDTFERAESKGEGVIGDEGLIPLYLGKELIQERVYTRWEDAQEDVESIGVRVAETTDGPRKMFLTKLVESLRMAMLLFRGGDASFEEKLVRHVGVPAEPISDQFIGSLADQLDGLLTRTEYKSGSLRERIVAWEAGNRVEPEKLESVFAELMSEAQELTDRLVVPTDGYTMELNPVRDVIYSARCNFVEKKMDLNVGNSFSRTGLKHLVAHECFPGHSTQNIFTLKAFTEGRATADVLLCSLNGITGVIQEGIGDQGIHLINWIDDIDDEIQTTLGRYRSAVATQCAWRINVDKISDEEAYRYLSEDGAMQETRARGRIGMARHKFRAPFVASYFYGNEAVRRVRRAVESDPGRRSAFVTELYGKMHSPESLCLATNVTYKSYGE